MGLSNLIPETQDWVFSGF